MESTGGETQHKAGEETVSVLLPIPTDRPYTYRVGDQPLGPGDIVRVPLGSRQVAGVVVGPATDVVSPERLRGVEEKFDCPPLAHELLEFIAAVARYTLSPPGMVMRMVLRSPVALDPPAPGEGYRFTDVLPERMTPARQRVLEHAPAGLVWTRPGLAHAAGVSSSVVGGLITAGTLEPAPIPPPLAADPPNPDQAHPELSSDQHAAAEQVLSRISADGYSTCLIEGVTGSGKTEVYFEAVAAALREGRQVLILLPEIALTKTFLDRFEVRFGARPAEWHSDVAPATRDKVWRQVATGQVRVVAGARSALFLPFAELGLIVVDEEHDSAYKQEDRVIYNARDMAVLRGSIADIPVLLSSATPSIETRVNADQGRYEHVRLDRRFGAAKLPQIHPIDMRRNPPERGRFLSPVLTDAIGETIARGEQALVFLNRRGYAPLTLCRVCGHRFECPNCSAWLVEHRFRRQLACHHCGHAQPIPEACPNCGALDHLVACGPGVERLAEETLERFPQARIMMLSSDLAGGVRRLRLELAAIAAGEVDIVIGTQIVAKGHNFPMMTCVGVVDADLGLANGDPRAAERTFQLLTQVTGRAGRSGRESEAYLQSYQPDHPVIEAIASGDGEAFYEREIAARQATGLPPFTRLAGIIVSANARAPAEDHARAIRRASPVDGPVLVLGPAEAPLAVIRNRYRFRLLLRAPRNFDLQAYITHVLSKAPRPTGSVRVQVDIDPQSFL